MKKHIYLIAAMTAALAAPMTSCSDNDEPPQPDTPGCPMLFAASDRTELSRSSSPLSLTHETFRASAYKYTAGDQLAETVMSEYLVKYFDTEWDYDGSAHASVPLLAAQDLKYWDAYAESYRFVAYAPADGSADAGVTISPAGVTIPGFITANTTDIATDWVVASHRRVISSVTDYDLCTATESPFQPETYTSRVHLLFHHIFSKIQFRIYNTGECDARVTAAEISLSDPVYTSGKYTAGAWTHPAGSATSRTITSASGVAITVPAATTRAEALPLTAPIYQIPQRCAPADAENNLHISLTVNGKDVEGDFTVSDIWDYDKVYVYYISVNSELEPILVSVEVEDFVQGGTVNDEQTNW